LQPQLCGFYFLNVDNLAVIFDKIFLMKLCCIIFVMFFCSSLFSQYYYNDIVSNSQSNKQYQLFKSNKIKSVKVTSYDAQNKSMKDFSLTQDFSSDFTKSVTSSTVDSSAASTLTTFYDNNKVIGTSNFTKGIETKTDYSYDEKGRLLSIVSATTDTAFNNNATEQHIWFYNQQNHIDYMLKIKNVNDTTRIEFINDQHGNVIEEHWKKKNKSIETYYYYYNENSLLTDIVRFNKRVQKLLPDFLFEYDDLGRVIQMKQVPAGSSNYFIWKYVYNDKGLKQEETCLDKQKEPLGKMVYRYQ